MAQHPPTSQPAQPSRTAQVTQSASAQVTRDAQPAQPAPAARPDRPDRRRVGRHGEDLAAAHLIDHGWEVLERNWRPGPSTADGEAPLRGELDIIARDPAGHLAVIEVKTRSSLAYGTPAEAVGPTKLARLRALATCWARHQEAPPGPLRLDVISVLLAPGGTATLRHHQGVGC